MIYAYSQESEEVSKTGEWLCWIKKY
jgi:hypothetical protein